MKSIPQTVVLLLEDQPLIAMHTEDMLRQIGFTQIQHFTSVQPALEWLASATPDLAITEVRLQEQPSSVVAQQLDDRKVPVLVYSAANRRFAPEPCWRHAGWLTKPSDIDLLHLALIQLMDRQAPAADLLAVQQTG